MTSQDPLKTPQKIDPLDELIHLIYHNDVLNDRKNADRLIRFKNEHGTFEGIDDDGNTLYHHIAGFRNLEDFEAYCKVGGRSNSILNKYGQTGGDIIKNSGMPDLIKLAALAEDEVCKKYLNDLHQQPKRTAPAKKRPFLILASILCLSLEAFHLGASHNHDVQPIMASTPPVVSAPLSVAPQEIAPSIPDEQPPVVQASPDTGSESAEQIAGELASSLTNTSKQYKIVYQHELKLLHKIQHDDANGLDNSADTARYLDYNGVQMEKKLGVDSNAGTASFGNGQDRSHDKNDQDPPWTSPTPGFDEQSFHRPAKPAPALLRLI